MSLKPQGQIYRQKENSVIFFHVFIVTVKMGLLLSIWRHFYCSPFLTDPQAHGVTAEWSQGLSANHCLCRKLSAPWVPWVRADSCICTGVDQSGTSNWWSWSNSQLLQPIVNYFIKNTIWKASLVKQEIKLRQMMHILEKCHQFKTSYSLHPLQCFPWNPLNGFQFGQGTW